jgi:hypothetical protein
VGGPPSAPPDPQTIPDPHRAPRSLRSPVGGGGGLPDDVAGEAGTNPALIALSPEGLSRSDAPAAGRRETSRWLCHKGDSLIVLSGPERDRLRAQLAKVKTCGWAGMDLRSATYQNRSIEERRLILRMSCGLRVCNRCEARFRSTERNRIVGNWTTFWTFTWPTEFDMREAWTTAPAAASRLFHAVRAHVRRCPQLWGLHPDDPFHYAWVLEAQERGAPHIHAVTNVWVPSLPYLWSMWQEVMGGLRSRIDVEEIIHKRNAERYLVKYITKARLTRDIYAIMYRRRVWATTLKLGEQGPSSWERVGYLNPGVTHRAIKRSEEFGEDGGWDLEWARDSVGAQWVRERPAARLIGGRIVPTESIAEAEELELDDALRHDEDRRD